MWLRPVGPDWWLCPIGPIARKLLDLIDCIASSIDRLLARLRPIGCRVARTAYGRIGVDTREAHDMYEIFAYIMCVMYASALPTLDCITYQPLGGLSGVLECSFGDFELSWKDLKDSCVSSDLRVKNIYFVLFLKVLSSKHRFSLGF